MFRALCLRPSLLVITYCGCFWPPAYGQSQVVEVTVHSGGLEKSLLHDPADQPVCVYLPAVYAEEAERRFPVLYFLHGFGAEPGSRRDEAQTLAKSMDELVAGGSAQPMIVVVPNGSNKLRGGFYINSATTGDWDDYITRDVVGYVDSHYRTLANADHRGITGHSMGGFGALTLSFRHPDVFRAVYAMSPCCTDLVGDLSASNAAWARISALESPEDGPKALREGQFFVGANLAMAAALAPNRASKTLGDLPFVMHGKTMATNPEAYARFAANMPANMVFPFLHNVAQLKGIFVEYGAQENFTHIPIGAQKLAERLSEAGISYTLEVFQGDHGNRTVQRMKERMLPWMSKMIGE